MGTPVTGPVFNTVTFCTEKMKVFYVEESFQNTVLKT